MIASPCKIKNALENAVSLIEQNNKLADDAMSIITEQQEFIVFLKKIICVLSGLCLGSCLIIFYISVIKEL